MRDVVTDIKMARIIRAAHNLENWAFDEIYKLYADKIYRFVLVRVGDQAAAEDLTGELFLRVLNRIESFQGKTVAAFSAWIFRIARNLIVDHFRLKAKRQPTTIDRARTVADESQSNLPQKTEQRQTHEALYEAIRQLTPEQQQVVALKFFEGMGNAEVAKILGKTEGSVKSLQHRALAALGRLFPDQGQ